MRHGKKIRVCITVDEDIYMDYTSALRSLGLKFSPLTSELMRYFVNTLGEKIDQPDTQLGNQDTVTDI